MLIPTALHGLYPEVRTRIRKKMKAIIKGASLNETVACDDLLETSFKKGSIYLERPAKGFEESPNFHAEPLPRLLYEASLDGKISPERDDALFTELISTAWGTLLLTGRSNAQDWLGSAHVEDGDIITTVFHDRIAAFLDAFYAHYLTMAHSGPIFRRSINDDLPIWDRAGGVLFALANAGVPLEEVTRFRETGALPERPTHKLTS
jgi:hypothetical protein